MDNILIVAATKNEVKGLFPEINTCSLKMGEVYKKNTRIDILVCGVGPINSAIFLERAILKNNIKGVVNIGIAGSFDIVKLPIGSITIAKKEIWPEYGLKKKGYIDHKGLNLGLIKLKDKKVIYNEIDIPVEQNLNKIGLSFRDNFYRTTNLTVAGVTGTMDEAQKLKKRYMADVENMEGFSLAYTCLIHDIPFIEIRTISNLVGSRDLVHWDIKKALSKLKEISYLFDVQ